jgi:hypothetical protein
VCVQYCDCAGYFSTLAPRSFFQSSRVSRLAGEVSAAERLCCPFAESHEEKQVHMHSDGR